MILNGMFLRCPECGSKEIQILGHKEMYMIDDGCRVKCKKCFKYGKLWQFRVREPITFTE